MTLRWSDGLLQGGTSICGCRPGPSRQQQGQAQAAGRPAGGGAAGSSGAGSHLAANARLLRRLGSHRSFI